MKRVAVVEDDDDVRQLMLALLAGRETAWARDGAEGLELARRWKPDLFVLDLFMPRMHGFELCQRLRADPDLRGAKILFVSSKSYRSDIRAAVEDTGADAYLVKPFTADGFRRAVASLLGEG